MLQPGGHLVVPTPSGERFTQRTAERLAGDTAARTIEGEVVTPDGPTKEELDQQVAYLKTFGQVVRVQLRAYLEALLRDVEEEWGKADPAVVLSPPALETFVSQALSTANSQPDRWRAWISSTSRLPSSRLPAAGEPGVRAMCANNSWLPSPNSA